jgi:hypothetical protein
MTRRRGNNWVVHQHGPRRRSLGFGSAWLLAVATLADAQQSPIGTLVPTWQPNGPVSALLLDGDTLYAGGSFDQVGPRTGTFAVVAPSDATSFVTTSGLEREIDAVISDGAGGWFVRVPYVPDPRAREILHILPNGVRDSAWTPPTFGLGGGVVEAMTMDAAGPLLIAGRFNEVNGVTRLGLAALDRTTGALLPWNPQITFAFASQAAFRVAAAANRVVVTGPFTAVGGTPRNGAAVLDAATGAVMGGTLPSTLTNPYILSVAITATRVYLQGGCRDGGFFVCAYDLDLNPITGWTFPPAELTMAVGPSAVYVVERITGPQLRHRVKKLDLQTGAVVPWSAPDVGQGISHVATLTVTAVLGDTLYLGGSFSDVNGQPRTRVAAVDATTGALLPWAPLVGGPVLDVAATSTGVALGGRFLSVGGAPHRNVVAIDLRTGRSRASTPPIDMFQVRALQKLGDVMVVGGSRLPGTQAPDLVAFSTTTGAPIPWSLSSNGVIGALAADSRRLYVGGLFSAISGSVRLHLASVDLGTGGLTSWNPSPDGGVSTVAESGGVLFAAGDFKTLPGYGRAGVAAFGTGTGEVLSFNPGVSPDSGRVRGFGFFQNRVLLAGEPDGVNKGAFRWVDRTSGSTVPPTSPTPAGFTAEGSAQVGSTVYAAGRSVLLASMDVASGKTALWNGGGAAGDFGEAAVAASSDYVAFGGGSSFSPFSPNTPPNTLAVFRAPGAGTPERMTSAVANSTVTLGWQPGPPPAATSYQVEAGTSFGATDVGVFAVGAATRVSGTLPAGTYFTRVRGVGSSRVGAASSEVIVTVPSTSTPPNAPGTLSATVQPAFASGVVTLGWGAASGNATTYVIEAGSASGLADIGTFTTGVLDTGFSTLVPFGTYYVRIRAANAFGASLPSNELVVTVP